MQKLFFNLLIAAAMTGCGSGDNGGDPGNNGSQGGGPAPEALYLRVAPETLTFAADGTPVDGGRFIVETNGEWQAEVNTKQDWPQLSATEGTGNGSVRVTVPDQNDAGECIEVTFTARDASGDTQSRNVFVILKGELRIDLDFALGPKISHPSLPGKSEEALTGRGEYRMDARPFAVHADGKVNGKYFWVDNSLYSAAIPEPNKGLYFSKQGAYIEFPAIAGKALSEVILTPTTSASGDVELEICDTEDAMVDHTLDYTEDGSLRFTLATPEANTRYRLEVVNTKNAQAARLQLTYKDAQ